MGWRRNNQGQLVFDLGSGDPGLQGGSQDIQPAPSPSGSQQNPQIPGGVAGFGATNRYNSNVAALASAQARAAAQVQAHQRSINIARQIATVGGLPNLDLSQLTSGVNPYGDESNQTVAVFSNALKHMGVQNGEQIVADAIKNGQLDPHNPEQGQIKQLINQALTSSGRAASEKLAADPAKLAAAAQSAGQEPAGQKLPSWLKLPGQSAVRDEALGGFLDARSQGLPTTQFKNETAAGKIVSDKPLNDTQKRYAQQYQEGLVGLAQGSTPDEKISINTPGGMVELPGGSADLRFKQRTDAIAKLFGIKGDSLGDPSKERTPGVGPRPDVLSTLFHTDEFHDRATNLIVHHYGPVFSPQQIDQATQEAMKKGGIKDANGNDIPYDGLTDEEKQKVDAAREQAVATYQRAYAQNFVDLSETGNEKNPFKIAADATEKTGLPPADVVATLQARGAANAKNISEAEKSKQADYLANVMESIGKEKHGMVHNLLFGGIENMGATAAQSVAGNAVKLDSKQLAKEAADLYKKANENQSLDGSSGQFTRNQAMRLALQAGAGQDAAKPYNVSLVRHLASMGLGALNVLQLAALPLMAGDLANAGAAGVRQVAAGGLRSVATKEAAQALASGTAKAAAGGSAFNVGMGQLGALSATGKFNPKAIPGEAGMGALYGAPFGLLGLRGIQARQEAPKVAGINLADANAPVIRGEAGSQAPLQLREGVPTMEQVNKRGQLMLPPPSTDMERLAQARFKAAFGGKLPAGKGVTVDPEGNAMLHRMLLSEPSKLGVPMGEAYRHGSERAVIGIHPDGSPIYEEVPFKIIDEQAAENARRIAAGKPVKPAADSPGVKTPTQNEALKGDDAKLAALGYDSSKRAALNGDEVKAIIKGGTPASVRFPKGVDPLLGHEIKNMEDVRLAHWAGGQMVDKMVKNLAPDLVRGGANDPAFKAFFIDSIEHPERTLENAAKFERQATTAAGGVARTSEERVSQFVNAVDSWRTFTENARRLGGVYGRDFGIVKNAQGEYTYFPHIWQKAADEVSQGHVIGEKNEFFTRSRQYKSHAAGIANGEQTKFTNVIDDLAHYSSSLKRDVQGAAAERALRQAKPGEVASLAEGYKQTGRIPGFKVINHPGLDHLQVSKGVEKDLRPITESSTSDHWIGRAYDNINQGTKEIQLGGGLFHGALKEPLIRTGISLWRTLTGSPTSPALIRGARAFLSKDYYANYVKTHLQTPDWHGDTLENWASKLGMTDRRMDDLGKVNEDIVLQNIGHSKANLIKTIHDATFAREIPFFKYEELKSVLKDTDPRTTEGFAKARQAVKEINAAYGGLNNEVRGRTPTFQRWLRRLTLAPDFNEGKLINVGGAFKGGESGKVARGAVIGQAAVIFAMAEIAHHLTSHHFASHLFRDTLVDPSIPLPWKNKKGQKLEAGIPTSDMGDLIKLFKDPQRFLVARASAMLSLMGEVFTGKDYYGNDLPGSNILTKTGSAILSKAPIPVLQAQKAATGKQNVGTTLLNIYGFRVHKQPDDKTGTAAAAKDTLLSNLVQGIQKLQKGGGILGGPDLKPGDLDALSKIIKGSSEGGTLGVAAGGSKQFYSELKKQFGGDAVSAGRADLAYQQLQAALRGVRGSVTDRAALEYDRAGGTLKGGEYEYQKRMTDIQNKEIDESIANGKVSRYLQGMSDEELRKIYQDNLAKGEAGDLEAQKRAEAIVPLLRDYLAQASAYGRTDLNTYANQLKAGEGLTKFDLTKGFDQNTVDFAGLGDVQQRKLYQMFPGLQTSGINTQADALQQYLINAGIISPFTKANQVFDANAPIYKGGKREVSRLGVDPNSILSGAYKPQSSGSKSGGGGGKRGGRHKGGGRKGGGGRGKLYLGGLTLSRRGLKKAKISKPKKFKRPLIKRLAHA